MRAICEVAEGREFRDLGKQQVQPCREIAKLRVRMPGVSMIQPPPAIAWSERDVVVWRPSECTSRMLPLRWKAEFAGHRIMPTHRSKDFAKQSRSPLC